MNREAVHRLLRILAYIEKCDNLEDRYEYSLEDLMSMYDLDYHDAECLRAFIVLRMVGIMSKSWTIGVW